MKKLTKFLTVFLLALLGANLQPAWARNTFWETKMWYQVNGGTEQTYEFKSEMSGWGAIDLGNITSNFKINQMEFYCWDDWNDYSNPYGKIFYKINGGTQQEYACSDTRDWAKGGNNFTIYKNGGMAYEIANSSKQRSGKYSMKFFFEVNGNNGYDKIQINNGGNWFEFKYNILPSEPTGFSASVANSGGGSGQATNNPFIIYYNQDVTLTVSASASSDSNEKLQFSFDNGSTWVDADDNNKATTTIKTSNTSSSVSKAIKYRYYNTVDNLEGTQSSTTIYYRSAEYTITLDKNGGTADGHCRVKYGATGIVSWNVNTDLDATKTGYKLTSLKNYTLSAASESTVMLSSHSGTFPANTTYTDANGKWKEASNNAKLHAQWTAQEYNVTLDYNNGSGTTVTKKVTYDDDKNLTQVTSNPLPTKTGQDFTGYWTNNDGTGTQLVGSNGYFLDEVSGYIKATKLWGYADNLTIYAGWANHAYTITYKDQGDKDFSGDWGTTVHPTTHTYNTATTLVDAPDKTGYTFGGWFISSTCEGAAVTELGATAYTADITLYAKWNPTTTTITLYRNDGTETTTTHVATYDGAATAITNLTDAVRTREGYSHNGMYAANTGGNFIIKYDNGWKYNSTVSTYATSTQWRYTGTTLGLYSQWTAKNYNLTLNDDGGTGGSGTTQVTFDAKPANVNVPTKVVSEIAQIFTGYYYNDIQIFNNSGAIVLNAGNGTYTDNSGNWKYDGVLTLTAKWEAPAKQKVYFGVTNGTTADETSGTVSAKIKSTSTDISSGDQIDAGTVITITFSAKQGQYINNNGWKIASWWDGENFATAHKLADAAGNSNSYDYTVPTTESYVYAYAPEVTNTFAIIVNSEQTRMGSVDPVQGTAGPNVMQTITATPNDGYSFVNWTQASDKFVFVSPSTNESATANVALKNNADQTITANFKINEYTITYTGLLDGSTHAGNPETYTIESATINFTPATSVFGHKFRSWSPTSIAAGSTGDKTITAQYDDVTLSAVASANIIEGKQATITPTLTAPSSTYYYQYTCASIATFNVGANGVATFTAPAAGDYAITVNVYEGSDNTGVKLATTNVNITVNEDLSANWYIVGQSELLPLQTDNWVRSENYRFSKPSKDAKSAYIDLVITEGQVNNTYEFKLQDCGQDNDPMFGWGTNGNYRTFEKTTTYDIYTGTQDNLRIIPKMVGTYRFSIDWSNGHNLTVTYPDEGHRMVTVDNGVTSTQVQVNEFTETDLVADQYLNGMRFNGWVVTNSEGVVQENKITINTPTSCSTHMHGATEDGLIVKATYTSHGIIYFKNNPGWSEVKVYFYSGEYFDETFGTGCLADGDEGKRKANGYGMTHLANTDIWYYDWQSANITPNTTIIAFTVNLQTKAKWFDENQVVYRGDWHDEAPLFVPYNHIHRYLNKHDSKQTCYYDEGLWMKYNSTESGYDIRGNWGTSTWTKLPEQSFKATSAGGYEFFTEMIQLPNSEREFKIYFDPNTEGPEYNTFGTAQGKGNKISSATPYTKVYENTGNAYIQPTAAAGYIFKLSLGDGQIIVSVEYPLSPGDYQVVSVTNDKAHSNGIIYKQGAEASLASFFIEKGKTTALKLQKCSTIVDNEPVWENTSVTCNIPSDMATGIYNFRINPLATNPTIENLNQKYSGKYYIRTDGVDGGWESYQTNADNEMYDYGSMLDAGVTYGNFPYDYYKTKWIKKNKNVKFTIANDYSKCISDSLVGDAIIGDEVMTLPEDANVRFMWNSATNQLKRAYISGSTNISDRFLVLEGDAKMFDKDGKALTKVGGGKIDGLNDNEMNFADNNNWVYQADIKAQPGCAVKLTAAYNGTVQYFIGTSSESKMIIDGTSESSTKYYMRAVYDFKTNRLVAGWIPDDKEPISDVIKLGGDMLLVREHQGDANQITFGTGGKVTDIKHIYSVLTIKKDVMLGTADGYNNTPATNDDYARTMYWISFPFEVKISEVFGVDGYGKKWIMQKYNGKKRAEIGWFAETSTFWEFMDEDETLNAYEGYLLLLDAKYFNTEGADVWKNSATEANFYFPSTKDEIGIIKADTYPQDVDDHACSIDREFSIGKNDEGEDIMVNHMNTDSYWNVIGVPAFQNATAGATPANDNFKSYYAWVPATNTYSAEPVDVGGVTFKTMHAYMVQFGGTLTWSNVSVVSNPAKTPYAYADTKNYRIELFFSNSEAEDHTYINLADEANTDFVLNEDMMKIDNAGFPNIYSFAGNYNVAYNETKMDNQSVMLGVSAPKQGTYTFSMPKEFSGTAKLIDLVEGITTDLNVSNYSVDLEKGTYNSRFQLLLEVEAKAPTSIEADGQKGREADGKTTKLLRNGNIYLINAGRVYNATGAELR